MYRVLLVILFFIVYGIGLSANLCNYKDSISNEDISNYILLTVKFDKDTLKYDEDLQLTLVFQNRTYRYIRFCPKAYIACFIIKKHINTHTKYWHFLNMDLDLDEVILKPKDFYEDSYTFKISDLPVEKGDNYLYILYRFPDLENNVLKKSLYSPEFKIYLKE
jgi:hypothetical protein